MNRYLNHTFVKSTLALAITSTLGICNVALAVEEAKKAAEEKGIEVISITASHRKSSIQEAPMNITALGGGVMEKQNINQLSDVARWVPGLTIPDQGSRTGSPIIVRGLNTSASGPDSDGGTVATYLGETPLNVDMKIIDVERIEVLIGPQGTLYGAGTLGGAIRYIPTKPVLFETSGSVSGDLGNLSHSSNSSGEARVIFNTPIIEDKLAIRFAVNYLDEAGYVDYNYLIKEPGVSLTDPDWNDPEAVSQNIRSKHDANNEKTTTARIVLRWQPNDDIDSTLSYFYQKQELGGRSIVHNDSLAQSNPLSSQIGEYESAYRYLEPIEKKASLLSLEVKVNLDFAELVSATSMSNSKSDGKRDQTDLLMFLDYSYEEFPSFSTFTRDEDNIDTKTEELRLVSTGDSNISWVAGLFYNNQKKSNKGQEFTPGYGEYRVDTWGADQSRPDDLEYIQKSEQEITEKALFGELAYQATDKLRLTVGARFYDYSVDAAIGFDTPLLNTMFYGAAPDEINLNLENVNAGDNGQIFKVNADYKFNDDVMVYGTVSEGYRLGGSNGVAPCPDNIDEIDRQIICALPHEVSFKPDEITNYELGIKSSWLNNYFHFNAALFMVDWKNAQVGTFAENGGVDITVNAAAATSKGIEISTRAALTDQLSAFATYAYTKSELSEDAPLLNDFFGGVAKNGDRLPGTPEHQFSLGVSYLTTLTDEIDMDLNYGLTYQSDVYSQVGLLNYGEKLPSYALSNASAVFYKDDWSVTLYIDNMFDKYAYASVRRTSADITVNNDPSLQRYYGHYLVTPRKIGIRFKYDFDL